MGRKVLRRIPENAIGVNVEVRAEGIGGNVHSIDGVRRKLGTIAIILITPVMYFMLVRNGSSSFYAAVLIIVVWALTGPIFNFSDTWQLIINTGTTIVTFLMVFLIQNTQNRDSKAVHLKLDELIRALTGARNHLVDLEKLSDVELKKLEQEFKKLSERASRSNEASTKKAAEK